MAKKTSPRLSTTLLPSLLFWQAAPLPPPPEGRAPPSSPGRPHPSLLPQKATPLPPPLAGRPAPAAAECGPPPSP
eukprot:365454-Chlamydomonas_euryale.AAC.3